MIYSLLQVHLFSYQCSQLSTPESIIEVFKSAEKFQSSQDIQQYVSIVVLDEVGLAEDSPSLPLKALHPLLEDGTVGSGKDHQHQVNTINMYLYHCFPYAIHNYAGCGAREKSSFYWNLQLGPGPCQDESGSNDY